MKKWAKYIFVASRNVIIVIVLLEVLLGVFYFYNDTSGIDENTQKRIDSGVYGDLEPEIVKEIFQELRVQYMQWDPYTGYRLKKMNGKHHTISNKGIRKTLNLNLKDSTTAINIFCFGGSTMFGGGSRDEFTIPSELSKLIYKSYPDLNIEITNFGCHGYTRAMENVQLQREITKNNIPDIVIFYDGVNEVISAHQNNEAGLPTNAYNRIKEFNLGYDYKKRIQLFITSSNIIRLTKTLRAKLLTGKFYPKLDTRSNELAKEVAETYVNYVKLSKALDNTYNYTTFNFVQPVIYSKKQLTNAEEILADDHSYYKNLYDISYDHIKRDSLLIEDSTFIDISNAFNKKTRTIYTDFCHTGEYGNLIVAKNIMVYLKPLLSKKYQLLE
ncbi:SGNH/GDSL hydrolase family protein [Aquimarina sp. M1]